MPSRCALGRGIPFLPPISVRPRTDRRKTWAYVPRVGGNTMRTFQCLNVECEEESPVGAIDWIDDQHVVQCWLCGQIHALKQLPSDQDASIRFAIAGVVDD